MYCQNLSNSPTSKIKFLERASFPQTCLPTPTVASRQGKVVFLSGNLSVSLWNRVWRGHPLYIYSAKTYPTRLQVKSNSERASSLYIRCPKKKKKPPLFSVRECIERASFLYINIQLPNKISRWLTMIILSKSVPQLSSLFCQWVGRGGWGGGILQ